MIKQFDYHLPTQIHFGPGRLKELGEIVKRYGDRCLVVSGPKSGSLKDVYPKIMENLDSGGVAAAHFDGIIPNPTTDTIEAGARMAQDHRAEVIVGIGGGSSMDSAKAIAVEATHEGSCWDYLFFRDTQPTEKTLPIIEVPSTSGTGSPVNQCGVVTHTQTRDKSALWHQNLFPRVGLIDPELTLTVPKRMTAATGFDMFCHAFESFISSGCSTYTEMMSLEAMAMIVKALPKVLRDGSDLDARTDLAWADTLAGMGISNAGVTLPHGMAMAIGGMYPHVAHGQALALLYPACSRFTFEAAIPKFALMGRILDPALEKHSDKEAAQKSCELIDEFLKRIDLWLCLKDLKVPEDELPALAKQCMVLPDRENNPRVATLDDMKELLDQSFSR